MHLKASCGLAKVSLLCGICGVFLGPLTGIPAIITGHMSLAKIRKSGGILQGNGLAIAGLILGYIFTAVTVVFLILSMVGYAVGNSAIKEARKTTCRAAAIGIESAINNFYSEYGCMPQDGVSDATVTTDVDSAILEVLLGLNTTLNTRGVKFLSVKEGEDGKNGLIYGTAGVRVLGLYDPWGGGYKIRMDLDYDEKLDVKGEILEGQRAAVWSDGPDRKSYTEDDIRTWRVTP